MTAQPRTIDRAVEALLRAEGPQAAPETFMEGAITAALATRQRRPLVRALDARAWPRTVAVAHPTRFRRSGVVLAVAVAAMLALVAAGAWIGSAPVPTPRPTSSAPSPSRPVAHVTLTDGPDVPNLVGPTIGLRSGGILSILWTPEGKLTAAILDSEQGPWRDLGVLPFAATDGEPVLLHDGRVFLLAQNDLAGGVPSAVVFDPETERFAPGLSAKTARSAGMPIALADGRVMVLGGSPDGSGVLQQQIQIFDPVRAAWSSGGSLELYGTTVDFAPVLLADGRVLVLTYRGDSGQPLGLLLVDPRTGAVTRSDADLPDSVAQTGGFDISTIRAQPDGRVLFFGPPQDGGVAAVMAWKPGESKLELFAAPGGFQVVQLRNGLLLVMDGNNGTATVWNPSTGASELVGPFAATYPIGVPLVDGRVALVGGYVRGAPIGPSGTPPTSRAVQFLRFD